MSNGLANFQEILITDASHSQSESRTSPSTHIHSHTHTHKFNQTQNMHDCVRCGGTMRFPHGICGNEKKQRKLRKKREEKIRWKNFKILFDWNSQRARLFVDVEKWTNMYYSQTSNEHKSNNNKNVSQILHFTICARTKHVLFAYQSIERNTAVVLSLLDRNPISHCVTDNNNNSSSSSNIKPAFAHFMQLCIRVRRFRDKKNRNKKIFAKRRIFGWKERMENLLLRSHGCLSLYRCLSTRSEQISVKPENLIQFGCWCTQFLEVELIQWNTSNVAVLFDGPETGTMISSGINRMKHRNSMNHQFFDIFSYAMTFDIGNGHTLTPGHSNSR